jgi:hypothetical protein
MPHSVALAAAVMQARAHGERAEPAMALALAPAAEPEEAPEEMAALLLEAAALLEEDCAMASEAEARATRATKKRIVVVGGGREKGIGLRDLYSLARRRITLLSLQTLNSMNPMCSPLPLPSPRSLLSCHTSRTITLVQILDQERRVTLGRRAEIAAAAWWTCINKVTCRNFNSNSAQGRQLTCRPHRV